MKRLALSLALLCAISAMAHTRHTSQCSCNFCKLCKAFEKATPNTKRHFKLYNLVTIETYRILYNNGNTNTNKPTLSLLRNENFMRLIQQGFDGLCLVKDTTGVISYFYGALNNYKH